jgi:hypothetical protein
MSEHIVALALAAAKRLFIEHANLEPALSVSSDGFMQEDGSHAWDAAISWASHTLGRDVPNPSGAKAEISRWEDGGAAQNTGQGQSH